LYPAAAHVLRLRAQGLRQTLEIVYAEEILPAINRTFAKTDATLRKELKEWVSQMGDSPLKGTRLARWYPDALSGANRLSTVDFLKRQPLAFKIQVGKWRVNFPKLVYLRCPGAVVECTPRFPGTFVKPCDSVVNQRVVISPGHTLKTHQIAKLSFWLFVWLFAKAASARLSGRISDWNAFWQKRSVDAVTAS